MGLFSKRTKYIEENEKKHDELMNLKEEQPINLEKNDTLAIIIAALTTVFPFALVVILVIFGIAYLIFS